MINDNMESIQVNPVRINKIQEHEGKPSGVSQQKPAMKEQDMKTEMQEENPVKVEFMKPNANLMFQNILYFHDVYMNFYLFAELFIFLYKGLRIYYPPDSIGVELACLFFFYFFSKGRFYLGKLGNKSEVSAYILFFLFFSIVPLYSYCYFLFLQTYSLKIEVIINTIGGCILALDFVFSIISILIVSSNEKSM